jgi:tetratricopeptide (TPR) repeat protein
VQREQIPAIASPESCAIIERFWSCIVRHILIVPALILAAMPLATMQTEPQAGSVDVDIDDCGDDNPDVSIDGCTAILRSKQAISAWRLHAFFSRGQAYSKKGLEDRAIADFTSAMTLKPELETLVKLQGSISLSYIGKHLYSESIASSSKMIELKPNNPDGYQLRGYAYELSGQRDKAITDYRMTLKLHPDAENVKQALTRLGTTP